MNKEELVEKILAIIEKGCDGVPCKECHADGRSNCSNIFIANCIVDFINKYKSTRNIVLEKERDFYRETLHQILSNS